MTKEEKKEYFREYMRKYRNEHKEKLLEQEKQWREDNRDKVLEIKKRYNQNHKETRQIWRDKNKEKISEYQNSYRKTPAGRACRLLSIYKTLDKRYNRGECTLTTQWIIENIFSKPCAHCGETDWHKIGCNRIDNKLPHTPDNVEPCCYECNVKLQGANRNKEGRFISK